MIFEYDKIVVGSSLKALLYAFVNEYPVFFTLPQKPARFEYLSAKLDLSSLKLPINIQTLHSFDDKRAVGIQKLLLWERLIFLLSLKGLSPLSGYAHSLRCSDSCMVASNEYSKIMEMNFKTCYYFGDPHGAGFIEKRKVDEPIYICYDYIAFNKGGKHEIDYIETPDDFVGKIWFYPSDRIDGNTPVRDACAISKLSRLQLLNFDYSETMARFKTVQVMKDNGMKGKFNGYTKKGTPRHYDFRTTSMRREIRSQENEIDAASSNIQIEDTSEEALLRDLPTAVRPFNRFLERLDENTS